MKIREVWTDRGLQNRVTDAALFPTLYSPSSWALSRDYRPRLAGYDVTIFSCPLIRLEIPEIPTSVLGPHPRAPVRR